MKTSSICGTDMHFYRKSWEDMVAFRKVLGGSPDTITGHEPCGIVEETGAGVGAVLPGDRVSVYPHIGCGTCRYCRLGDVMSSSHGTDLPRRRDRERSRMAPGSSTVEFGT